MEKPPPKVSREAVLAVWAAEDGRCEACSRAMDKRLAKVARLDEQQPRTVDNLQLLCVDCKAYRSDPLTTCQLTLGGAVAERILGQLTPAQLAPATRWLAGQLRRSGVIVGVGSTERYYWLPGVGTFHLLFPGDGTAVMEAVEKVSPTPQVRLKPQACTRGLPRPDRATPPPALARSRPKQSA